MGLPAIDLHLDAVGAAPALFIRGMAAEKRVDISGIFASDGGYAFGDRASFLKVRDAACSVLTSPEDWGRLTHVVLEECASNGVIYCEMRLSPTECGGGDPGAWREHLLAVAEAADQGVVQGVILRGIATCLRRRGPAAARAAAICAAETAGGFLVGFGMDGEGEGDADSAKPYAWAFDCAREPGLGLTADAGTQGGADAIRTTMQDLRVTRIGGGMRAVEDLALVDDLAEAGIVLETCPAMDIGLGHAPGWRQHPAGRLYDRGVKLALCSGGPAAFGGFARTAESLHRAFDWDEGVFRTLAQNALSAAFCDADTRDRIQKRLT